MTLLLSACGPGHGDRAKLDTWLLGVRVPAGPQVGFLT